MTRLRTHPGVGLVASLAPAHIPEPAARFPRARKQAPCAGLDPVEYSSAEKRRYGSISKEGFRFLRFLLVVTTRKAVNGDPVMKAFYYRLSQRKERAKARTSVSITRSSTVR